MPIRSAFPDLPLLSAALDRVRMELSGQFGGVHVAGVQHLLPTTGTLIETLLSLGVSPGNVILQGKCYSTCRPVAEALRGLGVDVRLGTIPPAPGGYAAAVHEDLERLWQDVRVRVAEGKARLLVLLDDGGRLLSSVPLEVSRSVPVIGVEQTTSGLLELDSRGPHVPHIDVASSAVKRILEPRCIGRAVVERISLHFGEAHWPLECGVIGLGVIGQAAAQAAEELGHELRLFDIDPVKAAFPHAIRCGDVVDLVRRSGVVIGCTGTESLGLEQLFRGLTGPLVLASASSGDVEFRSIVGRASEAGAASVPSPFSPLVCTDPLSRNPITVLNGGYPVNFTRDAELEPVGEIQLTRALLFGAVVQAVLLSKRPRVSAGRIQLNPQVQRFIYSSWAASTQSDYRSRSAQAWSRRWIQERSGGCYVADRRLEELFAIP